MTQAVAYLTLCAVVALCAAVAYHRIRAAWQGRPR